MKKREGTNKILNEKDIIKKLAIKTHERLRLVDISEIEYIKSEGCYSEIGTRGGEKYIVSKPLRYYDNLLSVYGFVRVHNSYIINPYRVEEIIGGRVIKLKLTGGSEVPVSMYKKSEILNMYVY